MSVAAEPRGVPVGSRAGEYEIREIIGRGGMGTVYAGVHPVIGKEVAIKVLDPALATSDAVVARFVREARAVNKIQHPNIIDIFAFGHSPGVGHYFVMPRLHGQSLADRIAAGPMAVTEMLPLLAQIVDALDAAHGAGIAHRDLKPDNIFLVPDRRGGVMVQLLDFGIAKLLDGDPGTVTRSGTAMGTPLFMAPEQWDTSGIDHRADIYALGIIVHNMLTGRYPFESTSPLALMNMHGTQAPCLPGEHGGPPVIDPVIARALAKDKQYRQQSARELYAELAAAIGDPSLAPPPPSAPVGRATPARVTTLESSNGAHDGIAVTGRRRGKLALAGVAILAVAALVIVLATGGGSSSPAVTPTHDGAAAGATALDAGEIDAGVLVDEPIDAGAAIDARAMGDGRARSVRRDAAPAPPVPLDAASARPPADAGSARRPAIDASTWGATVDPFTEGTP